MSQSWLWRACMASVWICFLGMQTGCFEPAPVYASYRPSSPEGDAISDAKPGWSLIPELHIIEPMPTPAHPHVDEPTPPAPPQSQEDAASEAHDEAVKAADEPLSEKLIGVININTASAEQLQILPRVGEAMSQRIVDYRARRAFTQPRHLRRVKGIGKATYARFAMHVVVEGETSLRGR